MEEADVTIAFVPGQTATKAAEVMPIISVQTAKQLTTLAQLI